uniref:F5/8 type C domain-containing protein n=1 Tax=Trichobilharzia regenti TaxID=157069 RepID=A0AA85K2T0_TRIRE|nr:unnamed protein product [Trichobilharzia regenti]
MYITCKCWIILLFLFSLIWRVNTYKAEQIIRRGPGQDPQCADPLINSADKFPDASFSSSSVWKNATDFQPFRARLTEVYGSNEHTSGYAWCPNTHVEDGLREWIQAEFSHLVIISVIFTVGRGDGNVKEYMPNFVLRYQREDNGIWYEHVKSDGTRVLKANSDPRNIARTTLDSVVIAKRIRIYPYSHRSKQQVCLRFALYGCNFPDGVTSYSMPQGDTVTYGRPLFGSLYSVPHSFQDLTYDGQLIESDNQLMGGIGQLMDNVAYLGNVTLLSDSHPTQPGFHFVGWQIPNRDLRIVFKFDEVRSFIWLRIFTFDSIPLQSRVFSRAVVEFSMDGKSFGKPVEILTSRARMVDPNQISSTKLSISDMHSSRVKRSPNSVSTLTQETIVYSNRDWDGALVVQMPLTSHTGRYVSLTLTPSDSWILLSEVQFNSTIVQPESLLANNEEVDSLTKSVGGNSNSGDSHEQNSHLDVNLFRNSPLAADPETNKQANKMNSGSEVQSPIVGNEKSSISTHDERLSGAESSSNGENYYLSSSSSAAASASASSSSSKSMSTSTTPSTQLPQIIVIVSYVLGGILSLFILLALIIIVQRRCRHHLHFKHQCCKQLAVETTGISSSNPSGGFYSPISLIGAYGNNNNPNNNNNSLMNYNVVNTMNIPEAAKLLQSIPTLSPNARTTENFVHNCLPNGSGGVGVVHHPNSLLQYAMNNSNNNNNNTSVTDSNSVIVNNNNNNNTNNTRFGGTGGVGKLDYVSSVPPPLPPANLLLPRVPQTTMYGGVSDANVNSTTTNNNDQFIAQTSLYMQTNPNRLATTLVASDLNSLGGMNNFMPSYIVLPSLTTNSGYILQPIITSTMERQYHANNCDNSNDDDDSRAQDSASLYTSIRNSLVNSNTIYSGVSGTNSEQADGCYSPILENQTLLHPYHYDENVNHTGDDSGNMVLEKERSPCVTMVDKQTNLVNSHNGEDNSTLLKDVLPISLRQQQQQQQQYGNDNSYLSKIFASGRNSSGKSKRIDSEEQTTLMRRQGDVKGQQSCGELSTKQGVTNHLVNRRKRRPLSQQISSFFLKSNNSHRSSVHSLPDSDEKLHPSNVIHSGCIKRSSIPCQNVIPPQSILQLSPRRSFLLLPYGRLEIFFA